ncbi:helix-turn-helix transcriptional regulator [Shinella fusca]|uniref:DNA-binding CsgD family transcriptional regulator n=1 Tax=Shinella fusca TaxID=544480 RepID=A0A7W7YUI1_9HYPH|nr:helix-turn-helix transcriptional regulator [Shinella fusca]MBB5042372.1 DNA-binding CsgD family transcriptional regulator [Shinella fusca]
MYHDRSIIDEIYEAAVLPEFWPRVLERVSEATDCYGGALFTLGKYGSASCATQSCQPHLTAMMQEGWAERNIRAKRVLEFARQEFVTDHDVCSEEEIENHPIYTEFLRPRGIGWSAATHVTGIDDDIVIFSIDQLYERGPIADETKAFLNELRPHIARASMLAARFRLERVNGTLESLSHLGVPAVACDRRGRVRLHNRQFERATESLDVMAFDILRIADRRADMMLRDALQALHDPGTPKSIPFVASDNNPVVLHVIPISLNARDVFSGMDAIVVLAPINLPGLPIKPLLQILYDITQAEAKVAEGLLQGLSPKDIAAIGGVGIETVRTHVKSLLAKTGSSRQTEFIARLSSFKL